MDFYKTRTWQILIKCEKSAGFWPFQSKIKNRLICFFLFVGLHSYAIPMLMALLLLEWSENMPIVIENVITIILAYGTSIKVLAAYFYRSRRAKMYSRIIDHLKKLNQEEFKIMTRYLDYGLKFSVAYITIANLAIAIIDCQPVGKIIYHTLFGNGTFDKQLPYHVEYHLDQDEYYIYMAFHMILADLCLVITVFTYDSSFVLAVQHTCALFKIVTLRLKKASEIAAKYKCNQGSFTQYEDEAKQLLIMAVDIHKDALEMIDLINDAFHLTWFFKLIETVIGGGALLCMMSRHIKEFALFINYTVYFMFIIVQFNVAFNRGQQVIDHATNVFDTCYDSEWESFSKKSVTMLHIIMIQRLRDSTLTGGKIFTLCNETYMNMLQTTFSYFTVISSLIGDGEDEL